ncbi:Dos2-interacting transcription regulator of RNA-Pol-II-domain-containing protein [Plectosphaerella plurivora]|uniref:MMS19 nucleotide excision repair protein n=1 Tax=Plectosphaerella plurivora TaxID=936078 RepID=A0A9P9AA91_9PEZI|nr:Dos2-interacting transcription regulator of RNA-Pol-II-domain-containing protein [Plectosphaerella plurivora]
MNNPFPELLAQWVQDDEFDKSDLPREAARFLQESEARTQAFNDLIAAAGRYIAGNNEDQILRARGYGFLSATIGGLPRGFLSTRQVQILVPFFASVYNNDVRGGVKAATEAIGYMINHKAFTPTVALQFLEGVIKLKDDFRKQEAKTRKLIFQQIYVVLATSDMVEEVEKTYGQNISLFRDLLDMVQIERDAGCLIVWFNILRTMLALYDLAPELTRDIFELFSASYFPISIKATATPSGITTDTMKKALRNCFAAHDRVAEHAFPYLLEKLNTGDVARAEVKVDVLVTMQECISSYLRVDTAILPYVDAIWTNLKYEVRNGEVDYTIAATLNVLRSLAKKLSGTDLVRYCSTVQQECADDLGSARVTEQAGKLLMSTLSAKYESFGIMASPTLASVTNQLRHTESEQHTQKLLSLAWSILKIRDELRPHHRDAEDPPDVASFEHTDPAFKALYHPLRQIVSRSFHDNADDDTLLCGIEATKALASLVSQKGVGANFPDLHSPLLFDSASIAAAVNDIVEKYIFMFNLLGQATEPRRNRLQLAHVELRECLQLCAKAAPPVLGAILDRMFAAIHTILEAKAPGWEQSVETLLRDAASVSTDIFILKAGDFIVTHYAVFVSKLLSSMERAFNNYQPVAWALHVVAAQESWIYMNNTWENLGDGPVCPKFTALDIAKVPADPRFAWDKWVPRLRKHYPELPVIQGESAVVFEEDTGKDEETVSTVESCDDHDAKEMIDQALADIHRLGLYVVREIYRSITRVVPETQARAISTNTRRVAIELTDMFTKHDKEAEDRFLIALSQYAKAVVSKIHVRRQMDLFLADEVIALFHGNERIDTENFHLTQKTSHIADLDGEQVRNCLMSPPDERLEEMLSGVRKNLRCPPMFPVNGLGQGRILPLSYGIFAGLQTFPDTGAPGSLDGAFEPWIDKFFPHRLLIAGLLGHEHPEDQTVEGYLLAMLTSLGNKFQIESMTVVSTMIPTYFKLLADPVLHTYTPGDERFSLLKRDLGEVGDDGTINKEGRIKVARRVLAVLAGMIRRPKSRGQQAAEMDQVWKYIEAAPRDRDIGHNLARAMEVLFAKNDAVTPELHSHITPLWLQRAYSLFAYSWIDSGLPVVGGDAIAATNCTIAALGALVNMPMAIWEARSYDIVKMCLCVMRSLPMGPDLARAVQLLNTIHGKEPKVIGAFLDSVVNDCILVLQMGDDGTVPDWLPQDFQTSEESHAAAGLVSLACVRLLGAIALKQDRAKLRRHAPMVCRELRQTSAMNIREVRSQTIKARQAWEDVHHDRPARD